MECVGTAIGVQRFFWNHACREKKTSWETPCERESCYSLSEDYHTFLAGEEAIKM